MRIFRRHPPSLSPLIPAKAGTQGRAKVLFRLRAAAQILNKPLRASWVPAFAGMSGIVVVLALSNAHFAFAQSQKPPDTYSQDDLKRVEQARDEALQRLRALEKASKAAAREASEIDEDLLTAAADSIRREEAATGAEGRLEQLANQTRIARAQLTADEAALEDLLATLMTFGARRPPALAASPEDTGAAVRAAILMGEAAPALSERARLLKSQIDELNALAAATYAEQQRLDFEEAALAARKEEIAALAAEKRLSNRSLAAETASLRAETRRLSAEAATLRDLLEGLARAAPSTPGLKPKPTPTPPTRTTARPPAKPPPGTPAPSASPTTSLTGHPLQPAAGTRLRRFGQTVNGVRHEGLTLATRSGAQVVAPMDARIQYAGEFRSYGLMVILDVGNNVLVIVSGLDTIYSEAGQWVLAGEPIGRMAGQKSPFPELYLEVRRSGQPVDPEKWLARGA
jgi:septal ring factor EnvC (AmiA/AmiB activator)